MYGLLLLFVLSFVGLLVVAMELVRGGACRSWRISGLSTATKWMKWRLGNLCELRVPLLKWL